MYAKYTIFSNILLCSYGQHFDHVVHERRGGGFMPPVRLVIQIDFDDISFVHFVTPEGLVLTYTDLPQTLKNRMRSILNGFQQRRIKEINFDTSRNIPALADNHPFELRLMRDEENFEELFELVVWWMHRDRRKKICRRDVKKNQPHPTWTCECGEVVMSERELCDNDHCSSWTKLALCTGAKKMQKLRLA